MEEKNNEALDITPEQTKGSELLPMMPPPLRMSMSGLLRLIGAALARGDITKEQAQQIRRNMGVSKSFFTKKKRDKAKEKRRRKIADASRRRNRGLGKGEKRSHGRS